LPKSLQLADLLQQNISLIVSNCRLKRFYKSGQYLKNKFILDPKEKEGVDPAAQQDQGLDQWLEDLDKELDILEEEQKERWGIDGKPE
jgi:hypothetical protein